VSSTSSPLLATHANCLPVGTRVSDFEIIGLIGEGGFGIVYLAKDTTLDRVVALKEFMPSSFAGRVDGIQVAVRAANHRGTFEAGLKSFINEAKMLARFAHPALVEVFRFWEGNGTAYMAMRLYRGETLRQALTRGGESFPEERIAQIMAPIFDALEMLHREQVFHRDIAPDNIMLADGRSVLLDFGSARRILGDGTQALTTILKPGYAPIEQYSDDGTMKQGAWTDVYALGGVLYHIATGKAPMQAVSRMLSDPMPSIADATGGRYSPVFSQAVAKAMSVHVDNRFQTVTEFRKALGWNVTQAQVVTLPPPQVWLEPDAAAPKTGQSAGEHRTESAKTSIPGLGARSVTNGLDPVVHGERSQSQRAVEAPSRAPLFIGIVVALVAAIGAGVWFSRSGNVASTAPVATPSAQTPTQAPAQTIPQTPPVTTPVTNAPDPTPTKAVTDPLPTAPVVLAEGIVRFAIKPRGRVVIDGITKGFAPPLDELKLPVGTHTVEIFNSPSAPVKRIIEVVPDAPVTITHSF
jgi:serine/threonine protein kinase